MDVDQFGHLARLLATRAGASRRAVGSAIAGVLTGVLTAPPSEVAGAKHRGKRRKRQQGKGRQPSAEGRKRKKVTVCHEGQTISVPSKKKKAHLRHGDTPGPCPLPKTPTPTTRPPDTCIPNCVGRMCGDDTCGGKCPPGCTGTDLCLSSQCVCQSDCNNRECGDDGCGATCGDCDPGETSSANGRCNCVPDCGDRVCGDDGCGGGCLPGCGADQVCDQGTCVCRPDCSGRECGDNGCGGDCGACDANEECTAAGRCHCVPDCTGKDCGSDGCGGACGQCVNNHDCLNGQCVCSVPAEPCGDICVNVQSDPANCGACGTACDVANGAGYCNLGECGIWYCNGSWRDCDGLFATGCETDTRSSTEHCGACGNHCDGANATGSCVDGVCNLVCDDGFARCDSSPQNGCETNLRTSVNHCGACNQPCPSGQVCFDGVCELPCGLGGPCRVFRTFDAFNGNMGGLAGADALCQQQAAVWHFSGTYMAWLSNDTESPDTRFLLKSPGPYWTAGRQLIANNWADLTSSELDHAIGSALYPFDRCSPVEPSWSNTRTDGTSRGAEGMHCQNWSSIGSTAFDAGSTGQCGVTTSKWTEGGNMTCSLGGRLICFQQS